jgi:selenide,water dikinase
MDDAAVIRLNDHQVLVQTVDFFTPIVDDPYTYGQIAAANALSDIYAMGAEPLTAMNIVGFPSCLEHWVLEEILRGGADKITESGAMLVGGHSIESPEPIYGLTVTGICSRDRIITNAGALVGDILVLTKPLGTGIMATAIKGEIASQTEASNIGAIMSELNLFASMAMVLSGAHGCTDITGFGFLGHAGELAVASQVALEIFADSVPVYPGVMEYAAMGLVPAGTYRNKEHMQDRVIFNSGVTEGQQDVLFDPQTSGGLLIAMSRDAYKRFCEFHEAKGRPCPPMVGRVSAGSPGVVTIIDGGME